MSGGRWAGRCAAALLAGALAGPLPALEVPFLSGRVVDLAGLLTEQEKQSVEQKLAAFEKKTGAQVAVLTIPSLEGEPLEDYSIRVVETWKLGRAGRDDGVLLLIARDDRKMRIEVGRGLEDRLTDLVAGRILDHVMRPLFREGKFGAGIEAGVDAILGTLEGLDVVPEEAPGAGAAELGGRAFMFMMYLVVVGVFSLIALLTSGRQSWVLYFFLMPFHLLFPMVLHPLAGVVLFAAWLVGFPIAKRLLKASGADKKLLKRHPGWGTFVGGGGGRGGWTSGGGWSRGGGWSGGGGFSGGGGSFGGGGASSGW